MEIHGEDLFTELPFGILREIFPHVPHALHVKAPGSRKRASKSSPKKTIALCSTPSNVSMVSSGSNAA
jgi:hypothetical protein